MSRDVEGRTQMPDDLSSDKSIFYCFLALLFWVPLPLGSNRAWASHLFEVVSFVLLIWWLCLYLKGRVDFSIAAKKAKLVLACLLSFAAINLLQLLPLPSGFVAALRPMVSGLEPGPFSTISIDVYSTWMHFKMTISFAVIALLCLLLVRTKGRLKLLALTFIISGVFQAVFGSLMTLSGVEWTFFIPKLHYLGNATGTFINRNHLANYLVLCLSMGTGLLLTDLYQNSAEGWRERGRRFAAAFLGSKLRIRISLALMVIALVLTHSRMGNMSFFLSLFVAGFVWLFLTKRITKGSVILLISLIVIDTIIVGAWFGLEQVKERVEATAIQDETRDEVNRDAFSLISDQPLLGSGAGSFYTAFPRSCP